MDITEISGLLIISLFEDIQHRILRFDLLIYNIFKVKYLVNLKHIFYNHKLGKIFC